MHFSKDLVMARRRKSDPMEFTRKYGTGKGAKKWPSMRTTGGSRRGKGGGGGGG